MKKKKQQFKELDIICPECGEKIDIVSFETKQFAIHIRYGLTTTHWECLNCNTIWDRKTGTVHEL